jgi:hypothetical protein
VDTRLTNIVALIFLVISSGLTLILVLHTVAGIIKKEIWRSEEKVGPLNFMFLTHEAFRAAIPKLLHLTDLLSHANQASVTDFATAMVGFMNANKVHAFHEDRVLFPAIDRYFPGLGQEQAANDHKHEGEQLQMIERVLVALVHGKTVPVAQGSSEGLTLDLVNGEEKTVNASLLVEYLKAHVPEVCNRFLEHLIFEEGHMTPVAAKYIPQAEHVRLAKDCWELTPNDQLASYIAWTLNNLPIPVWRGRFLKAWYSSAPERAQLLGLMAYRGVDNWIWSQLADEMPEIVPRCAGGCWRPFA